MQKALPSDTDLADHTEIIISEVDRLRNLVDRMLGPSKALRIEEVNITEVCEKTISLLNSEFDSRLCWERDYDPSLPEIHGDQDQLIQAILNIARNACEALINVDSPRIKFKSRFVGQFTIGDIRHRGVLRVEISDNGSGNYEERSSKNLLSHGNNQTEWFWDRPRRSAIHNQPT